MALTARDGRCRLDEDGYRTCLEVAHFAPGVCGDCELGSCAGCDAPMEPAECTESQRHVPGGAVYCGACRAAEDGGEDQIHTDTDTSNTKESTP
jgi:hypothetical protein